jgi:hypothetical protein
MRRFSGTEKALQYGAQNCKRARPPDRLVIATMRSLIFGFEEPER